MKRIVLACAVGLVATACTGDESVAAYGGADRVWVLESLDGAPYEERATLEFGENGRIAGQAPCNRYFGQQTAPYPWFKVEENLGTTMMACPNLDADAPFFEALSEMTQAEISGDVMRLNNEAGREMIWTAAPADEDAG